MNEPDFTKLAKQKGDRDPVQQIKHLIFEAEAEARTLRGSFHISIKVVYSLFSSSANCMRAFEVLVCLCVSSFALGF